MLMIKSFSLIEVIIAVVLVFIIGLTLAKISSQNVNTLQSVQNSKTYLHSLALQSSNEFKDINDYSSIEDLPKIEYKIEKELEELQNIRVELIEGFSLDFILQKQTITDENNDKKSYFRIK